MPRFENLSNESKQECLATGLAEAIINGLSRFEALFVIARHTSGICGAGGLGERVTGTNYGDSIFNSIQYSFYSFIRALFALTNNELYILSP